MYACDYGVMVTTGHGAQTERKLTPTGFISVYSTPDFKTWTCERAALLDRCESQLKKLLCLLVSAAHKLSIREKPARGKGRRAGGRTDQ